MRSTASNTSWWRSAAAAIRANTSPSACRTDGPRAATRGPADPRALFSYNPGRSVNRRLNMGSRRLGIWIGTALLLAGVQANAEEKIHELKASPTTVHRGFFDATLK